MRFAPSLGATSSTDVSSSLPASTRTVSVFDGQLYIVSGSSGSRGVSAVGSGTPTTAGQTVTRLTGLSDVLTPSNYGFFLAALNGPNADTLYVADDTNGAGGGITKFSLNSGTWVSKGTVGATADAYRGLTARVNGATVTLFATRKGGSGTTGGGELVTLTDNSGYDGAFSGTPTLLVSAATGTAFRGVALSPQVTVTPSAGANGSIDPNTPQVAAGGSTLAFTVTPNVGYTSAVGGTCGGTLVGTTYTTSPLTVNCTVSATFAPLPTYTVTPSSTGSGTISPSTPVSVVSGSTTNFTITADPGFSASVGGTCGGSLVGTTYTTNAVVADCTVIATFVAAVNGACGAANGVATGVAPSALCTDGSASAVTSAASQFTWTCNGFGGGTNASCAAPRTYTVTPSVVGGNGTATIPASGVVAYNATGTVTITPNAGFATVTPVGGTCGGTLVGTTYTTNAITADCTVIASFAQITYTMTPSAGANGTISPSTPQTVNAGATKLFTVTPDAGYSAAVGGTCGGSLVGTTYTTNAATANCTVDATFTALPTFTVTPVVTGNGSVSPAAAQTVPQNATVVFTPTPAPGYSVVVSGCGGKMSGGTFTTAPVTANCTVKVSFSTKNILFVGNSYTFARVDPAMTFNAANVNDLTADFNAAYPNGANSWPWSGPTCTGAAVQDGCFEPHPWGGVPGIFKALTVQAGLDYNVSLSTRNAATLRGHFLNTSNAVWDLRGNIASQKWDIVMVQGQSDEPLPANKSKNGNPASFKTYANQIAKYVHQGNGLAVDLVTTEQAIYAAEGFGTSASTTPRTIPPNFNANPGAKVFVMQNWSRPDMVEPHKCTVADYTSNDGAPLVDPNCANGANGVDGDNNVFYTSEPTTALNLNEITFAMNNSLSSLVTGNPQFSGVIPSGNAFQKAVDAGVVQNSAFYNESGTYDESGQINLWWLDRTHASKYGSYLSALVHFSRLTGQDPTQFGGSDAVASGLGILPTAAVMLQQMAKAAVVPGAPTSAVATAANGQVTVSFTAAENLGGLDVTGFTVTCGSQSVSGGASPIVVTGLTNGASVSCTVVATNSVGDSLPSSATSTVTPATVPGAPVIGTAVAGDAAVSVVFTAPPSDGGSPILSYAATCGSQSSSGATSPIMVNLLTNGVLVTCTVVATNAVGPGAASDPSNGVTPLAAQTITFPVVGTQTFAPSGTFSVAATASSLLSVSFSTLTSGVCTVTASTVTIVSAGTCTIRASQPGAAAIAAARSVDQDITIDKAPQSITFATQSPTTQSYVGGGSFAVNPLGTGGGSANPVTYSSQTPSVCTTGGTNGATVTMQSTGLCTIAANQAGDDNYLAAVPVPQNVQIVAPTITLSPTSVPSGTVGLSYSTQSLSATGGAAPHTFAVTLGALPAGLTLTGAGSLSGTPTAAGTFGFTVTATDASTAGVGGPFTGIRAYSIVVAKGSQTINFAALPNLPFGSPAFAVSASANSGLSVAFASQTAGVCTVAGTTVTLVATGTCTVRASQSGDANWDGATDVDRSFTVTAPAISLNPVTVPAGTVGLGYATQSLSATGGAAPHTFAVTLGALPAGLTLTGAGSLSGTPTAAGTFGFTVTATDASTAGVGGPFTGTQAYSIVVAKGSQTISFAALPNLPFGTSAFAVSALASSGLTVAFASQTAGVCSVAGTTVTLVATGTCTVRASQSGDTNWNGATDVDRSFTVTAPAISVNPVTVPAGTVGLGYATQSLSAAGGTGPYTFAVTTGTLPAGLTLTGAGSLSGTPTTAGTFGFTVTATDSSSVSVGGAFTGTQAYSIVVSKGLPVTVVSANLNPTVVGQTVAFTAVVTAVGPAVTGTVNFFDGVSAICSGVALTGTQAQCVTDTLPAGSRSITAVYSGDSHYLDSTSVVLTQTVNPSGTIVLTVAREGSGLGTVQGSPLGINCGSDCSETYATPTPVSLVATPNAGSIFTGWSGACVGRATCDLTMTASATVTATFAPAATALNLDVDDNRLYFAPSDGLLIARYLFGLRGSALTNGVLGDGATLTDPVQIAQRLDDIRPLLDVDGNGRADALTDGLLLLRYMLGLRGTALISGAVGTGATRANFGDVQTYLQSVTPALP